MNCLKCGRTVADGELLCPACSGKSPQPEPELESHPHLHTRTATHYKAITAADRPMVSVHAERRAHRLRRWVIVLVLALVLLAAATLLQTLRYSKTSSDLRDALECKQAAEATQQQLQQELDSAQSLINETEEALAQKDDIIAAYEQMTGIEADSLP